ncbi:MAG: sigma 54-interacting transcriptional regulator [Pseudomonadota bacterium]
MFSLIPETTLHPIERRAIAAFCTLAETSEGSVVIDRAGYITWISSRYRVLLGLDADLAVVGKPVEEILPESRLQEVMETGRPQVLDLMPFGEQNFVVCRVPLYNEHGEVDGAAGFIFYDRLEYLRPLMKKFHLLEKHLTHTRAALAHERKARYRLSNFIGVSQTVRDVKDRARQFASREGSVLILGETGVGKELLAHALHNASRRASGPFVAINMAAVPETLMESEFFGVVPGAFTGADRKARPGKFELADGGTLFLDEIGDMPLTIQSKFLRVLQEGEYEALGSNQIKSVDVRIVAATSQNLEAKIKNGSFRSDLFYRLNVLPLRLAPLRARLEDIDPLCEQMLEDLTYPDDGGAWLLTDGALATLKKHDWPGNVRELRNVLERTTALACGPVIEASQIEEALSETASVSPQSETPDGDAVQTLAQTLDKAERLAIERAMRAAGGSKVQAAALLGISRSQLYEKLKRQTT